MLYYDGSPSSTPCAHASMHVKCPWISRRRVSVLCVCMMCVGVYEVVVRDVCVCVCVCVYAVPVMSDVIWMLSVFFDAVPKLSGVM